MKTTGLFLMLSLISSSAFAGEIKKLNVQRRFYAGTLGDIVSQVESDLGKRAEAVCKSNVKRLFDFKAEITGNFEIRDAGTILSSDYPMIKTSMNVECE